MGGSQNREQKLASSERMIQVKTEHALNLGNVARGEVSTYSTLWALGGLTETCFVVKLIWELTLV